MKTLITIFVIIIIVLGAILLFRQKNVPPTNSTSNNTQLIETNLIRVASLRPNALIQSPITIRGEARGNWYFEASFPIRLIDANGNNIPLDPPYVMTTNEWMTTDFVPFNTTHTFTTPSTDTGTLILQKDNPSGLPEYDDEVRIPVRFR